MNDMPRTDHQALTTVCHENCRENQFECNERIRRLEEALDTLTLVVGLTPIAGNKDALQEAMNIARSELKSN